MFLLVLIFSVAVSPGFAQKCDTIKLEATVWLMDCSNRAIHRLPDYHKDRPVVHFNGHNSSLTSNITFAEWKNVKYIDLSFNNLHTIENNTLDGILELERLNVSYCSLRHINPDFERILIKILDLSGNDQLVSEDLFSVVNKSLDKGTANLHISNMALHNIPNDIFSKGKSLRRLYMRDNAITELPVMPPRLLFLDISNNSYSVIGPDPFALCSDLRTLVAQNNADLVNVDEDAFKFLPNLTVVILDGNRKLEFLPKGVFFHNRHLSRLHLSGCGFKTISRYFKPLFMDLSFLDLSGNPWECGPSIRWLATLNETTAGNITCDGNVALDEFYGDLKHSVLEQVIIVMVFATFLSFLIGLCCVYDLEKKRKSARPYWPLGKRTKMTSSVYVSTVV